MCTLGGSPQESRRQTKEQKNLTADRCMEGDRVEAERDAPRKVDVRARGRPEREAEEKIIIRSGRRDGDRSIDRKQLE